MGMIWSDGTTPLRVSLLEVVRCVVEVADPVIEDSEIVERNRNIGVIWAEPLASQPESFHEQRLGDGKITEIASGKRQVVQCPSEIRVPRPEPILANLQHPFIDFARLLQLARCEQTFAPGIARRGGQNVIRAQPLPSDRETPLEQWRRLAIPCLVVEKDSEIIEVGGGLLGVWATNALVHGQRHAIQTLRFREAPGRREIGAEAADRVGYFRTVWPIQATLESDHLAHQSGSHGILPHLVVHQRQLVQAARDLPALLSEVPPANFERLGEERLGGAVHSELPVHLPEHLEHLPLDLGLGAQLGSRSLSAAVQELTNIDRSRTLRVGGRKIEETQSQVLDLSCLLRLFERTSPFDRDRDDSSDQADQDQGSGAYTDTMAGCELSGAIGEGRPAGLHGQSAEIAFDVGEQRLGRGVALFRFLAKGPDHNVVQVPLEPRLPW